MDNDINDKVFNEFPVLQTERFNLRSFTKDDTADFFFMRSSEEVMQFIDIARHKTAEDTEKMIDKIFQMFKEKTGINWIIEDKISKAVAGYCLLFKIDRTNCRAEIGYALKPEFWGKGIAKEVIDKMSEFGFNEMNLHSIEANINPNNINSRKVLVKAGFKKEANFRENYFYNGRFLDSEIYCMIESDFKNRN